MIPFSSRIKYVQHKLCMAAGAVQ